jgi:hypothetical protein
MEAVEAKCGGCERSLLFRLGEHGGGEGTAGGSIAKILGVEHSTVPRIDRTQSALYIITMDLDIDNTQHSTPTAYYLWAISHKNGHFTGQMTRK